MRFVAARWTLLRLVVCRPGRREISRDDAANRHFLSWMVPGLGDFYFLQPSSLDDRDQTVRYDNPFAAEASRHERR